MVEVGVACEAVDEGVCTTAPETGAGAHGPQTLCVLCDTDIQVIEVWWWRKYAPALWQRRFSHRAPPRNLYPGWLQRHLANRSPRRYLLATPDLPWQFDKLRESPGERELLFDQYRRVLVRDKLPFRVVKGHGQVRLQSALEGLHRMTLA